MFRELINLIQQWYKTITVEKSLLQECNKFLEKSTSLKDLSAWRKVIHYVVRPNGIIDEIPIKKIIITIEDGKVNVSGYLADNSYITEPLNLNKNDIIRIANDFADNHLVDLNTEKKYLIKELTNIDKVIADVELRAKAKTLDELKPKKLGRATKAETIKMKEELVQLEEDFKKNVNTKKNDGKTKKMTVRKRG